MSQEFILLSLRGCRFPHSETVKNKGGVNKFGDRRKKQIQPKINSVLYVDHESLMSEASLFNQGMDSRLQELLKTSDEIVNEIDKSISASQQNEPLSKESWLGSDVKLMDHQVIGVNWLQCLHKMNYNGILADEMGLGKTLQVIAFFGELFASFNNRGPHLVVMPLSVISSWENDFSKFLQTKNHANILIHHGTKEYREYREYREYQFNLWFTKINNNTNKGKVAVVLTTYDMILKDIHLFKKFHWQYLVVDEAHRLKNKSAILFNDLKTIQSRHRLLLTGTPLQNNLNELWSLLSFLLPTFFNDEQQFCDWFNKPFESNDSNMEVDQENSSPDRNVSKKSRRSYCFSSPSKTTFLPSSVLAESETNTVVSSLHRVIRPFILRRVKSEVAPDLPPKFERIVYCPLSDIQLIIYKMFKKIVERRESQHHSINDDVRVTLEYRKLVKPLTSLRNVLIQLRKLCNHPYLILKDMRTIPEELYDKHVIQYSGKLLVLDKILNHLLESGSKVLIFCQMTSMLDIIEDYLQSKDIKCFRLDGNTSQEERQDQLSDFNSSDNNKNASVFLLSTRAGGVGINLQSADTVILFDSDWNPQQDLQAISRTHRIGQTKKVLILRLISTGPDIDVPSIEQNVLQAAHKKLMASRTVLADGVFDFGTNSSSNSSITLTSSDTAGSSESGSTSNEDLVSLQSPMKSLGDQDRYSIFEDGLNLEDDFNECLEDLKYINDDDEDTPKEIAKKSIMTLFDINVEVSKPITDSTANEVCTSLGKDHYMSYYDSVDFSPEGIQQICRRQIALLKLEKSSNGDECKVSKNTMDTVESIDADWHPWLDKEAVYDKKVEEINEYAKREIKRGAFAKRNNLYNIDALLGGSDNESDSKSNASPSKRKSSPTKKSNKRRKDEDEDYTDTEVDNNKVVYLNDDEICVVCDRAWVSSTDVCSMGHVSNAIQNTFLICEGCESSFHMVCVGLNEVPTGDWYCQFCETM